MVRKLLTVLGARPQFVKASAVSRAFLQNEWVRELIVHTGQHYDFAMSDIFFRELGIPEPSYHLGVGGASHAVQTAGMLTGLEQVLLTEKPDIVMVYGDTNSTLAGSLAASKLHYPVVHVEAGLRSFNRQMPEELNRVVTDHLSDLLFTPTDTATTNLAREGIPDERICQVGDVMLDATQMFLTRAEQSSDALERLRIRPGDYVLATIHRAENTDDFRQLEIIMFGLSRVAQKIPVVIPLHPRTAGVLRAHGWGGTEYPGLILISPVGYLDMLLLEKNAAVVVTDSGGVQKEAFFLETPCVTLRSETEWVELVSLGWNRLVPPSAAEVVEAGVLAAIGTRGEEGIHPYGIGQASHRISTFLESWNP